MTALIKKCCSVKARVRAEHLVHIAYCALVGIEGHGWYAMAGGLLAVLLVINAIFGGGE